MKQILFSQMPLKLGITLITILSVFSGITGVNKLSKSFSASADSIPEVENLKSDIEDYSEESSYKETNNTIDNESISPPPKRIAINKTNSNITMSNDGSPTLTPSSTQQPQTGCVITLYGKQYDVSTLRASHPGGNVFVCGTDMTTSYQAKHGTDMSRMQRYLVGNNGTINTPLPSITPSKYKDVDEKEDDHEEESEREELEHEFEEASHQYEDER